MQISRAKLCDSITKLTHFGYHDTYPDLGEVMQAAVTELEWVVAENVDDKPIKSNTIQKIRQDHLYNIRMGMPQNKALDAAAKAVFDEVFFLFKRKMLGWDFFCKVENYLSDVIKLTYKEEENSGLLDSAMDDFIKYYDPSYKSWKTFASDRLRKTYINKYKRDSNTDTRSTIDTDNSDDSQELTLANQPDDSTYGNSIENIRKIDMADLICDVMKQADKYTTSAVYKQFRCFFTFQMAELMDLNEFIYSHVRRHRKNYDAVVDIEFLNHYIDYDCHSITDAYGKERKLLSCFSGNDSDDIPCNTLNVHGDPQQVIYTSYLGKSAASISTNYKKYKELIHGAMAVNEKE